MRDLVEQLRGWPEAPGMSDDARRKTWLMRNAADKIERLESKLHAIYLELSQRAPQSSPGVERAIEITQED